MSNPWKSIDLNEYEKHMSLTSVMQLQALDFFMDKQFNMFDIKTVMILGVAGGNGLEHIDINKISKIYAVDINRDYLTECERRYPYLKSELECLCVDLTDKNAELPSAEMVIADLLIEYIGYETFQNIINKIHPQYVSCVIQKNTDSNFVSDSPYTHIFDSLESIHRNIDEEQLTQIMRYINYDLIDKAEQLLPNGKKLIMLTYKK